MLLNLEKVLILKSVMMFSAVPEEYLSDLATRCDERELQTGETLIQEDEFGSSMFVIVSGKVRVERRGQTVAYRGERDVIGELTVFDPHPRSASVITSEPTHVLEVPSRDVEDLMAENAEVLRAVVRMLSRKLRQSTDTIADREG